jgi:S1-C subfamily serine protease
MFYRKRARLRWKNDCSVNMPVTDAQGDVTLKKYIAQGLTAGKPAPGKDVAVLKIESPRDFPTLKIAGDSQLNVGDEIYVIGFPGAATIHPYLAKPSISEATLTKGIISAKKTAPAGFTLLQHDAATAPGNSGGPALDSSGKVIGIHTFGSSGREGRVQGFNFVVPASVIQEFLDKVGVRTEK